VTWDPVLVTSKVSVPAGASVAEILQASSLDSTVSDLGLPPVVSAPPSAFSVHAARNGTATTRADATRVRRMAELSLDRSQAWREWFSARNRRAGLPLREPSPYVAGR
jgi:hypothetical protein